MIYSSTKGQFSWGFPFTFKTYETLLIEPYLCTWPCGEFSNWKGKSWVLQLFSKEPKKMLARQFEWNCPGSKPKIVLIEKGKCCSNLKNHFLQFSLSEIRDSSVTSCVFQSSKSITYWMQTRYPSTPPKKRVTAKLHFSKALLKKTSKHQIILGERKHNSFSIEKK